MATQNIVNLSNGKIDPKYIPIIAPPATPTLNEVLTAGNTTDGILIDAHGGNVVCDAMKCISIEAATAPLFNDIAVDANLITAQFGKTGFSDNALITCNEANTPKNVIETTNASGNTIYKIAEGNISYDTSNKLLTVNPVGFPPSPLLVNQGLTVVGKINSQNGSITAGGDIYANNGILITKEASQPRVEFQDGGGTTQAQIGYNTSNGKTILQGSEVIIDESNVQKYLFSFGDSQGYLGLETKDAGIEFRRYNADASVMETRVIVNGGGNMAVGGANYDGSLFVVRAGAGAYGGLNINPSNDLTLFSGGGSVVSTQALRPDGGILDTASSTGSAGQILLKDGANNLTWATATPSAWSGSALTDLNMNQFNITNVPTISMTDTITDNPTIQLNTSAGTPALITGYNAGSYTGVQMTNVPQFQVWTGAVEGVQMGVNTSVGYENFFRGMGLPLRIAQDQGTEGATYLTFNNGDVELASANGGQFSITGGGALINCDSGIALNAISGNIYLQAPDGASYTNPDLNAVRTIEYERIPSMLCAIPFFASDKIGGGYTIDTTNPPLSPMVSTTAFTWAYSGKLVGLNNLSRFTTAGFVEVMMSGVLSDVNSDLAWSVELHDLTAGNRYITDLGAWGFNQSTPATDTSYTTFSRKGVNGTYVSTPTLRTTFDVVGLAPQIPDGNQVCVNIYVVSTQNSHPIGEFRWNVSVRPVNPFATW